MMIHSARLQLACFRSHGVCQAIIFFLLAVGIPAAAKAQQGALAAQLPAGAVAYAEVTGLEAVLQQLQNSDYLKVLLSSPQLQLLEKTPQYKKGQAVRKIVEAQIQLDLWTAGKKLLGNRVAAALYPHPGRNEPDGVLLVRVADAKTLAQVQERIQPLIELAGDQIDSSETIAGCKVLSLQKKVFIAVREDSIVAASTRELLTATLGLLAGEKTAALAGEESFQSLNRQMRGDHLLQTYVNTAALTKAKGSRLLPDKLDNPVGSMLLGGILELAANSPFGGIALDLQANRFALTASLAGDSRKLPEQYRCFFSDPAGSGTATIPHPKDLIAGFSLYCDFDNWYRKREMLLDAKLLPEFDKFETGLANLLPGKDFGEDVLPLVGKSVTFVAAPQDYSHLDGQPGVKLPGFGLILDLAKPAEAADIFQLFFQTITSLGNLAANQQGRQPWVMTSETYKDVLISFGRYLKKPSGERLPIVVNFTPASALVGNKFVMTSSVGLCRQLVEELQKPVANRPNRNLDLELNAASLAAILEANRDVFQARTVQAGKSEQQAREEFDLGIKLLRYFEAFRLSTAVKPESLEIQLEGSWK